MQRSPSIVRLIAFTFGIASLTGCGDDGGGGETDGSSTGGSSTGAVTTTMEAETTTGAGGSTSTGGGSTGGPEDSSGTSSPGTSDSGGSEDTGNADDCQALRDQTTCEDTKGCLWLGNPQNGECLSEDPAVCPELEMQQCQQHPACDWNNQDAACSPA